MNGFRITILTLLCLSVALMFYVVLFVIPGWQEEYSTYQSALRISEYDKKSDIHRRQMMAFDPAVESPEEEQARLAEEEAAKRNERTLQEAEESIVVAAARRREEAARARAEAEAAAKAEAEAKAASARPAAVGIVASYDPEWSCIMIKPAVVGAFSQGNTLAVRRGDRVICEAVVDGLDTESGQVSATVKMEQFVSDGVLALTAAPAAGDEVILSPFASGEDLRKEASGAAQPAPVATPVSEFDSLPQFAPVEDAAPAVPRTAPIAEPAPALQPVEPAPVATPAAPAEPAPAAEEVQRALDAVAAPAPAAEPTPAAVETPRPAPAPAAAETPKPAAEPAPAKPNPEPLRSNTSLPSLDAMLTAPLF